MVHTFMKRIQSAGLRLNPTKIRFKVTQAVFMGHLVTRDGLKPDPSKVSAVADLEAPTDKEGVRRILGVMTYLAKFCPQLSTISKPLRDLLRQDSAFIWAPQHDEALTHFKRLATSAPCLRYFDVEAPVVLQVDASDYGLGAALLQPRTGRDMPPDPELQPVAFASSSLTPTEQNYAQIEKECLAIVEGFEKFDQYLFGHPHVVVHSDHKPLETIFKKPLIKAPKRLQRMLLRLQRYDFTVEHRRGISLYLADTLSRAPLQGPAATKMKDQNVFRLRLETTAPTDAGIIPSSSALELISTAAAADGTMQALLGMVRHGWPEIKDDIAPNVRAYWNFRADLVCDGDFLYKGSRLVVPEAAQPALIKRIHRAHRGPEACISYAKGLLFWPSMGRDITNHCEQCSTCLAHKAATAPRQPMLSLPLPQRPWQYVSQDLFTLEGKSYLITVDHFSDFYEVDLLLDTLSRSIVTATKAHFARYGLPERVHTDNGPQFISETYKEFAKVWQFQHNTSSPYWHRMGGQKLL